MEVGGRGRSEKNNSIFILLALLAPCPHPLVLSTRALSARCFLCILFHCEQSKLHCMGLVT